MANKNHLQQIPINSETTRRVLKEDNNSYLNHLKSSNVSQDDPIFDLFAKRFSGESGNYVATEQADSFMNPNGPTID